MKDADEMKKAEKITKRLGNRNGEQINPPHRIETMLILNLGYYAAKYHTYFLYLTIYKRKCTSAKVKKAFNIFWQD